MEKSSLKMKKRYSFLVNEEQDKLLEERTIKAGFQNKSDYLRLIVFMEVSVIDKIDQIYNKICGGEDVRKKQE